MRGHVAHSCQGLHISLPDNGLTFPNAGRTGYSPFESESTDSPGIPGGLSREDERELELI